MAPRKANKIQRTPRHKIQRTPRHHIQGKNQKLYLMKKSRIHRMTMNKQPLPIWNDIERKTDSFFKELDGKNEINLAFMEWNGLCIVCPIIPYVVRLFLLVFVHRGRSLDDIFILILNPFFIENMFTFVFILIIISLISALVCHQDQPTLPRVVFDENHLCLLYCILVAFDSIICIQQETW